MIERTRCGYESLAQQRDAEQALAAFRATAKALDHVLRRHASPALCLAMNILRDAEKATQALQRASLQLSRRLTQRRRADPINPCVRVRSRRRRRAR